jgi:hypothetical protein
VVGARRNSVKEVLDYLGLRTPIPFSIDLIPKIESRLRASARFWDYSASFQHTDRLSNGLTLHIMIDEYKPAPPLSKPLSAVEAALLKKCEWLNGFTARDEHLVFSMRVKPSKEIPDNLSGTARLVVSPRGELAAEVIGQCKSLGKFHYGMIRQSDRNAFFLPQRGVKLDARTSPFFQTTFTSAMAPDKQALRWDRTGKWLFGIGNTSLDEDDEDPQPLVMDFTFEPVVFLYDAYREGSSTKIKDGILTYTDEGMIARSDAKTGRLLEWRIVTDDAGSEVHVVFQKDALPSMISKLDQQAKAYRNVYDPKAPIASFVSLLYGEYVLRHMPADQLTPAERERLVDIITKLVIRTSVAFADSIKKSDDGDEESFDIPFVAEDVERLTDVDGGWQVQVAHVLMLFGGRAFDYGTWPWTAAREGGFLMLGTGDGSQREILRLLKSDQFGPIGAWGMAKLVKDLSAGAADHVARQGLARLDLKDFRRDTLLILGDDAPLAPVIEAPLEVLRDLSDEEVQVVGKLLKPDSRAGWNKLVATLRANRDRPLRELVSGWLDDLWVASLRETVAKSLKSHRL